MKYIQSFAFILLTLWLVPGTEGEWRSTSVKKELRSLKNIFEVTLAKYDEVLATVAENCEPCEEECAPTCMTKQLKQFQERLEKLVSVIAKLEKLACHECPGAFWTDKAVATLGLETPGDPATGPAPVFRKLHIEDLNKIRDLSPRTLKNQLNGLLGNLKSVMVATNRRMFLEQKQTSSPLQGQPRAITFDPTTGDVYVAELLNDGAVHLARRSPSAGTVTKEMKTYLPNGQQPVDLAMYGKKLVVLLTNQTHSSLEIISVSIGTSTIKTTFPGTGRRLTVDKLNSFAYYTSNTGVYKYNIKDDSTPQLIADDANAVGIAFDSEGSRVFYCFSDNGDIKAYDPLNESVTSETKNNTGCSDMNVHHVKDIFGGQPLSETSTLHLYIASDTRNEVTEYLPGDANGEPRMQSHFISAGGTSMTLITT